MSLIDAVKSGKPFRRRAWGRNEWSSPDSWSKAFLKHDILADDWEIQEPAVTITRDQFWTAANGASSSRFGEVIWLDYAGIERLALRLGLYP